MYILGDTKYTYIIRNIHICILHEISTYYLCLKYIFIYVLNKRCSNITMFM